MTDALKSALETIMKPGFGESSPVTNDQIKLAKAITALDDLLNMVTQDHTVRKSEAYVRANSVLAVLKGTTPMPKHWKSE